MHFDLVDAVVERSAERVVTIKQVTAAEEYLRDHFPGFPVLPGVMMVEAMVQAARVLLRERGLPGRFVLGGARGIRYGRFVRPGESLRVEVWGAKEAGEGAWEVRGEAELLGVGGVCEDAGGDGERRTAVSGRLLLRPVRLGAGGGGV